uniref:Reverse transcriptase domain-containing protein n=1 Tax=Triticum urartu TaxID=4572 RepID=A0A8R7RCH7_TRIUA
MKNRRKSTGMWVTKGDANTGYLPRVTHLQYADDTLLLFEPDDHSVASVKLILLAFEIISGLKINFLKSEVIAIGMDPPLASHVANLLNCKLGSFPIKYLGLPISDKHISILE